MGGRLRPRAATRRHSTVGDSEVHAARGVARDRWFFGLHAPAAAESTPLADMDVYGTLAEKRVRLRASVLPAMYADARERTLRLLGEHLRASPEEQARHAEWARRACA